MSPFYGTAYLIRLLWQLILDKQIRNTIKQFMQVKNTVTWAEHSGDLRKAIQDGKLRKSRGKDCLLMNWLLGSWNTD